MLREGTKLALILMLICAIAGLALSYVNLLTADKIAQQKEERLARSLEVAYPAKSYKELPKAQFAEFEEVVALWQAQEPQGFVVQVEPKGYNDKISCLVGIDEEGKICGVSINEQTETPGLGAKIVESSFLDQYKGKKGKQALVKDGGQIEAISGATISSRALTEGVNTALAVFEEVDK